MGTQPQSRPPAEANPEKPPGFLDALKLDFGTVRIILVTAAVVLLFLSAPLLFILRNFVTFDTLDKYLRVTQNVRPKILHNISEELDSGFSRDFFIDSTPPVGKTKTDNTMLFYATKGQRVTLVAQAIAASGPFSPVSFQVDGCGLNQRWDQPFELLDFDLTKQIDKCSPDQPNLHTLRVVLPSGMSKGSNIEIKCLVIVYHRIHEHIEEEK